MALFVLIGVCAIAWAIAAEMRISSLRIKELRDSEALRKCHVKIAELGRQAADRSAIASQSSNIELIKLKKEVDSLEKSKNDLLKTLCMARDERDILQKKLDEARGRYGDLAAELESAKRDLSVTAAREKEAQENLRSERSARQQAVNAYAHLEAKVRSTNVSRYEEDLKHARLPQRMPISPNSSEGSRSLLPGNGSNYVIVDVETTGFSGDDEIVEIALIEIDLDGSVIDRFETTVRGSKASSVKALEKHGLAYEALLDSPSFEEVAHAIANFIDGRILIAHNLSFDSRLLGQAFKAVDGLAVDLGRGVDTLYGGSDKRRASLEALCKSIGLDYGAHTAMGDAEALLELLKRGSIKPNFYGRESAVKVSGLLRPGDCELRPRQMIDAEDRLQELTFEVRSPAPLAVGFKMGPLIALKTGDKVCCSCDSRGSKIRPVLYAKHEALGLVSARSVSVDHKCIVLEDFLSSAGKALQARRLGKPFVRADDFISYQEGELLQTWLPE